MNTWQAEEISRLSDEDVLDYIAYNLMTSFVPPYTITAPFLASTLPYSHATRGYENGVGVSYSCCRLQAYYVCNRLRTLAR